MSFKLSGLTNNEKDERISELEAKLAIAIEALDQYQHFDKLYVGYEKSFTLVAKEALKEIGGMK